MQKLRYRIRKTWLLLSRRRSHILFLVVLASTAVYILSLATNGFSANIQSFLINISTDIFGLIFAYVLFDTILHRIERDKIKEHPELDMPGFIDRVQYADRRVRILSTYTDFIFINLYKDTFLSAVKAATIRGVTFEFLLLDPRSSDNVATRQRSIGPSYDVEQNIRDNLREIQKIICEPKGVDPSKIKVRLYARTPPIAFNMVDDFAFVSFYPLNKSSSQSKQIEVSMRTELGNFLNDTFDDFWSSAEDRDLDKYYFIRLTTVDTNTERGTNSQINTYECNYVRLNEMMYVTDGDLSDYLWGKPVYPDFTAQLSKSTVVFKIEHINRGENREIFDKVSELFLKKYGGFADNAIFRITPKS